VLDVIRVVFVPVLRDTVRVVLPFLLRVVVFRTRDPLPIDLVVFLVYTII
jgi:hypothetical protein